LARRRHRGQLGHVLLSPGRGQQRVLVDRVSADSQAGRKLRGHLLRRPGRVSPEDDIEVRRMHITNRSRSARTIDVTSYAELVLAPAAADALHPAFSNLFVQTEIVRHRHAILGTRRPRSRDERVPWMFQLLTVHDAKTHEPSFETDRMRFVGRGGSLEFPAAMRERGPLSNTAGPVLDPIAAIRRPLVIGAGATATVDLVAGAADTRDAAL